MFSAQDLVSCWGSSGRSCSGSRRTLLAVVALVLTARYATESPRQPAHGFDIVGVCLFGVALLSLIYGVSAAQNGLAAPQAWIPLIGSTLALAAFVRHERQAPNPAVDLALFARPAFVVAVPVPPGDAGADPNTW